MVVHHQTHLAPYQLDRHDADYRAKWARWVAQTQFQIAELVAGSKETIATSKALIAETDRILTMATRRD